MNHFSRILSFAIGTAMTGIALATPPLFSGGSLNIDPNWNKSNPDSRPQLQWSIEHQTTIGDIVFIVPGSGSIWLPTQTRVRMKVLGSGKTTTPPPHLVSFWANFSDGEGWNLGFEGTPDTILARETVFDRVVPAFRTLKLGAKGITREEDSYSWFEFRENEHAHDLVRAFRKGDTVPSVVQSGPEPFLQPYLSTPTEGASQTVEIGPHDLLFLFELNATSTEDALFDLQDLVVLVTIEKA